MISHPMNAVIRRVASSAAELDTGSSCAALWKYKQKDSDKSGHRVSPAFQP